MRGQIGIGILYTLTFGLLGIGSLVDFIISLVKINAPYSSDEESFFFNTRGKWLDKDEYNAYSESRKKD
jgi:hypothetical protein